MKRFSRKSDKNCEKERERRSAVNQFVRLDKLIQKLMPTQLFMFYIRALKLMSLL